MPKILRVIPETDESVVRPVVIDIVRQLFDYTGISHNTTILYPGDNEAVQQGGSSITPTPKASFNETSRVRILVQEKVDPDYIFSSAKFVGENLRVFHDPVLDIHIKPQYSKTKVDIDFQYRGRDKIECERWIHDIAGRVEAERGVKVYKATYHYIIPEAFLAILSELHHLRENVAGYGEDYNDWFTQHLTPKASVLTNLAGRQGTWAVAETQQEIQGYFDFEGVPEKGDKEGDAETWQISFTYTFEYEKPITCVMRYPLMVHQQPLGPKWRPSAPPYNPADTARVYGNSRRHMRQFERQSYLARKCFTQGLSIPSYDEFIPASVPWDTKRVFTAMIALKPDGDLRTLFNLKQLGNSQFRPEILRYIQDDYQFHHILGESPFVLTLYAGADAMEQGAVTLTEDLTVVASKELDLRVPYHVRWGLVRNPRLLSKRCRDKLRDYASSTIEILKSIDCTLEGKGLLPKPLPGTDYLPSDELDNATDEIDRGNGNDSQLAVSQNVQFNTVQTFFIQTSKGA